MKSTGRIRVDAKGRTSLKRFLRTSGPVDLDVCVLEDGTIILTPLAMIPAPLIETSNVSFEEAKNHVFKEYDKLFKNLADR